MREIIIEGMGGMGDNVHQRAVVRWYMKSHRVHLTTPWPQVYQDLVGDSLVLHPMDTKLRTQAINQAKQKAAYSGAAPPGKKIRVWYAPDDVRRRGGVLQAMLAHCGVPQDQSDFRMPVPQSWVIRALQMLKPIPGRHILTFRPLVERAEWSGCKARNPDHTAYEALLNEVIRDYYSISLADIVQGKEWIVAGNARANDRFHNGQMDFEMIAGLLSVSAMSYCSPGFMAPLSQAVGCPVVVVFGNYECSSSFSGGAKFSPYLGIDTVDRCNCFTHSCKHNKSIDLATAKQRIKEFSRAHSTHAPQNQQVKTPDQAAQLVRHPGIGTSPLSASG